MNEQEPNNKSDTERNIEEKNREVEKIHRRIVEEAAAREKEAQEDQHRIESEKSITDIIEILEIEEMYSGLLENEEKANLIDGLRNLTILEEKDAEVGEGKEYLLDEDELIVGVYSLLEEFGLPADEILAKVGWFE